VQEVFMSRKQLIWVGLFALFLTGPGLGSARAAERDRGREGVTYRHMRAALSELREARKEMADARIDFGGHRKKALMAIDDAIRSLGGALDIRDKDDIRVEGRGRDFYKRHKATRGCARRRATCARRGRKCATPGPTSAG
jgi:hypothetical protein